uniref:Taste receptor type 2 n=1 Tax=Erpetoichthys calabaricus TaxID=27687 RepID=A0A8C4TDV4_ERPCA
KSFSASYIEMSLLGNLFIICCLIMPWGEEDKRRGGRNVNLTIGCVAGANASICFFSVVHVFVRLCKNICMNTLELYFLILFFLSTSYLCTIWFTALLFLLYCVKILPFQNGIFLKIKKNISKMVHWGIGSGFFLCSGTNTFQFLAIINQNKTLSGNDSTTTDCYSNSTSSMVLLFIFLVFYILLPLCLMNLSCVAICIFLYKHIHNIRTDALQNPHFERQKQIISMLFFQMLAYAGLASCFLLSTLPCLMLISQDAKEYLYSIGPPVYSLFTSVNLIFRNGFLRWKVRLLYCNISKLLYGPAGRCVWR